MLIRVILYTGLIGLGVGNLTTNAVVRMAGVYPQDAPGLLMEPLVQYGIGGVFIAFLIWLLQGTLKRYYKVVDGRMEDKDERIEQLLSDNNKLMQEIRERRLRDDKSD